MLALMSAPPEPPAGRGRDPGRPESPLLRYLPFIFLAAFIPVIMVMLVAAALVIGSFLRGATRAYWEARKNISTKGGFPSREMGNAEKLMSADLVVPSFDSADAHATAGRIVKEVLGTWPRARLASVAYQTVKPDGTIDLGKPEGGTVILTFYDFSKIDEAPADKASIPDAMISIVLQNNMILTNRGILQTANLDSAHPMKALPACNLKTLRQKASSAGHPEIGSANVYFPMMTPWLDEKTIRKRVEEILGSGSEKEMAEAMEKVGDKGWSEERFLSYFFEIPLYAGSDFASFFLLSDCSPVTFEDAKKIYSTFGL